MPHLKTAPAGIPSRNPALPIRRNRFAQANKEALITLGLYLGYFIWWYACAYGLGGGDPGGYSYVWGFPAWFFYSCLVGYPLLTLALWLVVRLFFRDMPLDAYPDAPGGAADSAPAKNPPTADSSGSL